MKKHYLVVLSFLTVLLLAGCQTSPIKSVTKFTDANGKGERTIYLAAFIDGSCQLQKSTTMEGDNWYVPQISEEHPTSLPCNTTQAVNTATSNGIVVPDNPNATVAEKWAAADAYILGLSTEEFPITKRVIQSANWSDNMMDVATYDNDNNPETPAVYSEWKAYVYMITYSWNNFDEYKTKTKALIGNDAWEISEPKALEDEGTPWASWSKETKACSTGTGNCDVVTFSEHESVLYWSVYGRLQSFYNSAYFKPDALGTTFDDYFFTLSDVSYSVGDKTFNAEITHKDDVNPDGSGYIPISVTAEFPVVEQPKETNNAVIYVAAGVAAVVVVSGAVLYFVKKR